MNVVGEEGCSWREWVRWKVGDITESIGNLLVWHNEDKCWGRGFSITSMESCESLFWWRSWLFKTFSFLSADVRSSPCLFPFSRLFEQAGVFGEIFCILQAAFVNSFGLPRALADIWFPSFWVSLLAVAGEFRGLGI